MPGTLPPDRTLIQEGSGYNSRFDVRTDAVMVYGVDASLPARVAGWRAHGYRVHLMTGLAWGHYQDYLLGRWDGRDHWDEAQRLADGKAKLHGPDIPYMVPGDSYAAYLESLLQQAVEAGVEAIFLEEPEFWSYTGYGPAFERAWVACYGRPYEDPLSSAESFSRAAELKLALYRDLIARLCAAVFRLTADRPGGPLPCYVATHSLLNYAHNRIVSPLSTLREIEHCRGAILQVWSHTARSRVLFEGMAGEQPFEVAFLEYGSGLELVRGTARRLWFLADPVEDSPHYGWDQYRAGYHATIVASLLYPEVCGYEIMPWPMRVFTGRYPRRAGGPPGDPIPQSYAAELLAVANALADMPDGPLAWDRGTRGLGVLMADSLMFRRAGPEQDDPEFSAFYGLALPLLAAAMPARPLSLEAIAAAGLPTDLHVLLLSYDGMTPPNPEAHTALAEWVRAGHALLLFGRANGPYETLPAWWNGGRGGPGPWPHLHGLLGLDGTPGLHECGRGVVIVEPEGPIALARRPDGAKLVRGRVRDALNALGAGAPAYREQATISLRRGPYLLAAAVGRLGDRQDTGTALQIDGRFIDMLDGDLPVRREIRLRPGEHVFLRDLDVRSDGEAAVLAASARVTDVTIAPRRLAFRLSGPINTPAIARVRLPAAPTRMQVDGNAATCAWDPISGTALLRRQNVPEGASYLVEW